MVCNTTRTLTFITSTKGVRFDSDHYMRVDRVRRERGLPVREDFMRPDNGAIPDHPLISRKFMVDGRDDVFTVDQVYEQWYMGWYTRLFALVNDTRSHEEQVIDAKRNQCDTLVDAADKFYNTVRFIS